MRYECDTIGREATIISEALSASDIATAAKRLGMSAEDSELSLESLHIRANYPDRPFRLDLRMQPSERQNVDGHVLRMKATVQPRTGTPEDVAEVINEAGRHEDTVVSVAEGAGFEPVNRVDAAEPGRLSLSAIEYGVIEFEAVFERDN